MGTPKLSSVRQGTVQSPTMKAFIALCLWSVVAAESYWGGYSGYGYRGGYGGGYGGRRGYYGKRSADAESDPQLLYGAGLPYPVYSGLHTPYAYGHGYGLGYGYHGLGYSHYYGKRSADAEPEAKADAEPYYGYYGYARPYGGLYGGYG